MGVQNSECINQGVLFNHFWYFLKQPLETTFDEVQCKLQLFEPVTLPHDWLIYNSRDLYETSSGWYKKEFDLTSNEGLFYSVRFEGVYMDTTVYVNGSWAGEWKYGYSTFEIDVTKHLIIGTNTILVKVCYQAPNSRWYSGAGIYRNVWWIQKEKNHIPSDGIYVHINGKEGKYNVEVETELRLEEKCVIKHSIFDGERLICSDMAEAEGENEQFQSLPVFFVELWSPDKPKLYTLRTELMNRGKCLQRIEQKIGFKDILMDPDMGFFINGKSVKLNGVCEHHDLGCLGAAWNKEIMINRLKKLKKMGVNALRTSHNMPAPELMDLLDEMGFLVISEAFDMWERPKTPYDYSRFFDEWVERDVASWIRRDRNHVSLLMWSIGNEIYDTHADERGQEITKKLAELVLRHDPKINAGVTIGSNFMPWENARKCADLVDYAGYNYGEKFYKKHHEDYPHWIIYGSETASIVQSRGIYHFPLNKGILFEDDRQCSALGNSTTSWGSKSYETCISEDRDMLFSLGQFLWTGFDYIGEPTPYDTKNSYFGQIDTAGFEKDSYYVYQSAWVNVKDQAMIHVFPHWQWNEGQLIDVRVCTNAPKMKLFLNNRLLLEKTLVRENKDDILLNLQVPFEKGELLAVAYDAEGNELARCSRKSFKEPATLRVSANKKVLKADGLDVAELTIETVDSDGFIVDSANNPVKVLIEGPGVLLGMDNGDSTDYDPYKGFVRRMFSGKLKAVIGSIIKDGLIKVRVNAKGMEPVEMLFESIPADLQGEQIVAAQKQKWFRSGQIMRTITQEEDDKWNETPIRRIELKSNGGLILTKDCPSVNVGVKVFPENAKDQELIYRLVTDTGVDTNLASWQRTDEGCIITGLGDGSFRLRCMARNGKDHPDIISELEFTSMGLGTAYKNPYEFISAGLLDESRGETGIGNERGVSTDNIGSTVLSFHHVDFGQYGSNIITLPIFAFDSKPLNIEIWEGVPGNPGAEKIDTVIYDHPTIWNLYQEETYKLSRRLNGVTTISFVFFSRVHLKGFIFEKINRAYENLPVNDCDMIYGDYFVREDWGFKDIGNNVSIIFEGMDFNSGIKAITICGRSITKKNTIHIKVTTSRGIHSQAVEFEGTQDFACKTFKLDSILGLGKVEFIFLPGSHFDFKWFRFEKEDTAK